jgi:hypothetical protein
MLKLYRSVVGAVSLIVTVIPERRGAVLPLDPVVSPTVARTGATLWLVPGVRAIAQSKSLATPNTPNCPVVTNEPGGAPDAPFALRVAPMAPEPLVPELSTPVKDMRVMEDETL